MLLVISLGLIRLHEENWLGDCCPAPSMAVTALIMNIGREDRMIQRFEISCVVDRPVSFKLLDESNFLPQHNGHIRAADTKKLVGIRCPRLNWALRAEMEGQQTTKELGCSTAFSPVQRFLSGRWPESVCQSCLSEQAIPSLLWFWCCGIVLCVHVVGSISEWVIFSNCGALHFGHGTHTHQRGRVCSR